jgi:hypothetical protein
MSKLRKSFSAQAQEEEAQEVLRTLQTLTILGDAFRGECSVTWTQRNIVTKPATNCSASPQNAEEDIHGTVSKIQRTSDTLLYLYDTFSSLLN